MTDRRVALITLASGYVGPPLARLLARSGHDLVLHLPGSGPSTMVDNAVSASSDNNGSDNNGSDNNGSDNNGSDNNGGDRAADAFADLIDELTALGAATEIVNDVDLSTQAGNEAVVQAALGRFGRLDAACFVTGSIITGPFLGSTLQQWDKLKRVNLDMVFHALQAALPPMVEAGHGQIVVFTSATGARPEPMVSLYGSTRAGANALVRAVGLEHAKYGVTVNAIGTNYMDFPGFLAATGADDPERRARIVAQVPMRRLGGMDELAEFTAVLLDGRSRFQTGQFFSYSGGWST